MASESQNADYPASVHSPINSSGFDNQYLGESDPTLGEAIEKISKEAQATQTKLGIGASPASSATTGQVLTKQAGGTTAWADASGGSSIIIDHDIVRDDTAPGKFIGVYSLTLDSVYHDYPSVSPLDLEVEAEVGDYIYVSASGFSAYSGAGDPTDIGAIGWGFSSIDADGNPINAWAASDSGASQAHGITYHIHNGGEGGFTLVSEKQVVAADIIGGLVTLRLYYIGSEVGVGGGSAVLQADINRNMIMSAETRRYS